jgi:hypothetical protein
MVLKNETFSQSSGSVSHILNVMLRTNNAFFLYSKSSTPSPMALWASTVATVEVMYLLYGG